MGTNWHRRWRRNKFLEEGHEYSPPLFHRSADSGIEHDQLESLVWSDRLHSTLTANRIAYGIMTTLNAYDNQIYAYGQGPSETTVSAPQTGVTTATPVTITGTVTGHLSRLKTRSSSSKLPQRPSMRI